MISPAIIQKAMDKKRAEDFDVTAFFNSVSFSSSYVETYFQKSPIKLMDSADEMFEESSLSHMELPITVWEMIKEDEKD